MIEAEITSGKGKEAITLKDDEIVIVPSGDVVVRVKGTTTTDIIYLDGRERPFQKTSDGHLFNFEAARSTGFHHLQVLPTHSFFFGTEDTKLKLDGILEMLRYLREEGMGWSGQLFFSDGSYLREDHFIYGWLDQHADRLLDTANRISFAPNRTSRRERKVTTQGGKRIDLKATMSLIRGHHDEYLVEDPNGALLFGPSDHDEGLFGYASKSYTLRKVVALVTKDSIDTPANRRSVWLVSQLYELARQVLPALTDPADRQRCNGWMGRAITTLHMSPLAKLYTKSIALPPPNEAGVEENTNDDYRVILEGSRLLEELNGPILGRERRPSYTYVKYSDEIYQSFVGHVVATALGMKPTTVGGAAFTNQNEELYLNVVPPPDLLRSWRSYVKGDPGDEFRPDLLFRRIAGELVVVADAKYRQKGNRAAESGRKEVMAYMEAYDLPSAILFFPPEDNTALAVHTIAAQGREIVEVTISPTPMLQSFLQMRLPPLLARLYRGATWRGR